MKSNLKPPEVTQTHVRQAKTIMEEADVPYTGYIWTYHKSLLNENPMGEALIKYYVDHCSSPDPYPKDTKQWLSEVNDALHADPVAEAFENIP